MKFYYNGNLIRTSKTHHYTHAVLNSEGKVLTCSATREGCVAFIRRYINEAFEGIENAKVAINSYNAGRNGYYGKLGRKEYYTTFRAGTTAESLHEWMDSCYERINWINENWKVVEIEERA